MPDIYTLSKQFRADLLAQERSATTEMVGAYASVYRRLQTEARALLDAIDQAETNGDVPNGLLSKSRRLEALRRQVLDEIHGFARFADTTITGQQRQAIYSAGDHARQLVLAGMGDAPLGILVAFHRLPTAAVEHLVGNLQDGSPLRALLNTLAPQVAAGVEAALVSGLALGKSPASISREIRGVTGQGLTRTLVISRTEVLRAYRQASLSSYMDINAQSAQAQRVSGAAEPKELVQGWRWTCSRSLRTCPVCLAMDGHEFPLDVPFGSHVSCRCVPIPVTLSWADLGYDVPEPLTRPRDTGEEWFWTQTRKAQKEVLGPGKFDLFVNGKLKLADLVEYRDDPRWGPTRTEKPLKDLRLKDV